MELSTDPIGGVWLTYFVAAVLLIAPWLVPPRAEGLAPRRRRLLQLLRSISTLVLLFAWVRPTLVHVQTETIRPSMLMLIDSSRSMSVEDSLGGASRWDAALRLLATDRSRSAIRRIAEKNDLQAFVFDRQLQPATIDGGEIELPETPAGEQTALGAALAEAIDAAGADTLAGVIVISDGAQRATPPRDDSPQSVINRLLAEAAPLYGVPVGERISGDRSDVAIEDLLVSDTAFAGAPLDARATLRVRGYPNRSVGVRLLWEDSQGEMEPVDAAQIVVRQGVDQYPITLRHAPPAPGEWRLTIAAETQEGETLTDNNQASTFVTVREGGVRVLYLAGATRIGGAPGREQRWIRSSLAASPDIALERIVINYKPLRRDLASRFAPGAVDVVILDNVDAEGLSRTTWRAMVDAVEGGAGLAMIGGRQSFGAGGHRDTLGDVLPITPRRAERQQLDGPLREDVHLQGPLRMVPQQPHPILEIGESSEGDLWRELPELLGANRLGGNLKPNARVLAQAEGSDEALLVIGQPGLGRALAFAGDSTWLWVLAGQREAHQRFWRQVVLWLAKKEDDQSNPVFVELGARRVPAGARLDVVAGVRVSEETAGEGDIEYQAVVLLPDGKTRELPMPGGGDRTSGVFLGTAIPGEYLVRVRAQRGGEQLGEAQARFLVPRRDLELERPGAEPDTLVRLATATADTGGRAIALEELPSLLTELAAAEAEQRREVVSRTTLYDQWPVLLLFAGLMTAEWLLRRRAGMP